METRIDTGSSCELSGSGGCSKISSGRDSDMTETRFQGLENSRCNVRRVPARGSICRRDGRKTKKCELDMGLSLSETEPRS